MSKNAALLMLGLLITCGYIQSDQSKTYKKALSNFEDYKSLVNEVEKHRESRLVGLEDFLILSKNPNTIILDSRSKDKFEELHMAGAVNLPFTDFTELTLRNIVPNKETRILIYCNNNIEDFQGVFPEKTFVRYDANGKPVEPRRPLTLALNIPTYVHLYAYGYRNVYELDEMIRIADQRAKWEGKLPSFTKNPSGFGQPPLIEQSVSREKN
jgi:hypothetical protein